MGLGDRLKARMRRFLERPGATVDLAPFRTLLPKIADREAELEQLTDAELTEAANDLRERAGDAKDDETLIEVCALGREAGRRALDERAYDVQLLGVMSLLAGHVAEMATGEGKTLAAALASFGYAVRGANVQVLTVNDYLARRDAEWMKPVYDRLGMSVGWIAGASTPEERREAYAADVTYVTVNEAGFDCLRDQLTTDADDVVQPEPEVAIVDEADSSLIDEARVPLVLAGATVTGETVLPAASALVSKMEAGRHYEVSEDGRNAHLTPAGSALAEEALGGIDLYAEDQVEALTAVNMALQAHTLLRRDVDYIVRDGKVELVDEFRGRVAHRRRWPDGLQAAVEAKEQLTLSEEGEVLGTITVQALLRRYPTLCGMTGTAVLVGDQLRTFYKLEVAAIPPNEPCVRDDEADRVYATAKDKEAALVEEVAATHATGRPVLIGTLDVAESERLAAALREADLHCAVLNAKNDAEEARIIAEAGRIGAITVSTQMAGRGIDIKLGGSGRSTTDAADAAADHDEVVKLGGLYVIGCGRHDSRRVDDQLRGRAGRQGDPGGSVFFVSLDDDLVTRHGQDAVPSEFHFDDSGLVDDEAVRRAVEHAQRVCEGINFELHRNTWRYHLVLEQQRQRVQERRVELRDSEAAGNLLAIERLDRWQELSEELGEEALQAAARQIALYHVDKGWAEHLAHLSDVREGIYLRALGRQDPFDEFNRAALLAFKDLLSTVDERILTTFDDVDITANGVDLAAEGLDRPTATWTYVVHDNPFGSELDRLFAAVGGRRQR